MITQKRNRLDQRYRHFDDIPMPVMIASGEDLVVDYTNRKAQELVEPPGRNVKGRPLNEILPSVFSSETVKKIYCNSILAGTRHLLNEKQVVVPDEQKPKRFWYNIDINPLRDDEGSPTGVILFFSDVTNQMIAKEAIGQREGYLRNFFRDAPVGLVCYRGPEFIVDLANDRALEMWGRR